MPVEAPGLSQHLNLGRFLLSSGREGGIASLGEGMASLGISPHKRPELQTIRHATYLPERPNVRGKPPGSGRGCRQERRWVPPGGSCPSPPHRRRSPSLCGSPAVPEERQKRAHGHTWGTAPSPGGFTGQPQALHGAGGRTALRSCCHHHTPRPALSTHTTSCPAAPAAPSCSCGTARVTSKNHTVLGRGISSSCRRLIRHDE